MKNKKVRRWLQIKVFIGLGVLVAAAAAVIYYINLLSHENYAKQELLSVVKQLQVQGEAINRRGSTYAKNPPRDYSPYFRDVAIFYPDFMVDLNEFENGINQVAALAAGLPQHRFSTNDGVLGSSIHNLREQWGKFKSGFLEKLGADLNEPRLEWGAEYVEENKKLFNLVTGLLVKSIEKEVNTQLEANSQLAVRAITAGCIALFLGIVWFYMSVVRRIAGTITGCRRVAQGDFGYELPVHGNDELAALAEAFNTLSARTRFVVTMLSDLQSYGGLDDKMQTLWEQASGYLPMEWVGLWELSPNNRSFLLLSSRTNIPVSVATQAKLLSASKNDTHILEISRNARAVKYDNLRGAASSLPNGRLVRELTKMGLVNSALIVPLESSGGWKGILVFVAADQNAYSDEQLELMMNLSPFMANGFEISRSSGVPAKEMTVPA